MRKRTLGVVLLACFIIEDHGKYIMTGGMALRSGFRDRGKDQALRNLGVQPRAQILIVALVGIVVRGRPLRAVQLCSTNPTCRAGQVS